MRVRVLRKQRSSLGRTGMVREDHGYRLYLPGPYLLRVRRRHQAPDAHETPPFPMPPLGRGLNAR
jgi:hypothetical protein